MTETVRLHFDLVKGARGFTAEVKLVTTELYVLSVQGVRHDMDCNSMTEVMDQIEARCDSFIQKGMTIELTKTRVC